MIASRWTNCFANGRFYFEFGYKKSAMKQTPFYEIGVALKGRPRIFRIIVVAVLHLSVLIMLNSIAEIWPGTEPPSSVKQVKPGNDFLSAENAETSFQNK
jgi:hypothetical protein